MARVFSDEPNKLTIHDNISGSDIVLFYRNPTTQEVSGYHNAALRRRRNKVEIRQAEARMKYGSIILTGFRDGDFVQADADGVNKPMSSTSEHPDYCPNWKAEVKKHAADLIMVLAQHVFDSPAEVEESDDSGDFEDAEKN